MSRRSKGKQKELMCRKNWEARGWLTDFKPSTRWTSDDLFEWFDFVAVKGGRTVFVQVKSNRSDFYKARKEIQAFLKDNDLMIEAQIWLWQARDAWRVAIMDKQGYKDIEMERA